MEDITQFGEKIMYLATAFRTEFPDKEESTFGKPEKIFCRSKETHPELNQQQFPEDSKIPTIGNTEEGSILPKKLYETDVTEWNKAFSKLRPPVNASKRRQPQSGGKYANKTCEEILQVVGSYKENLHSEKGLQQNLGNRKIMNEDVSYLLNRDTSKLVDDLESEEFFDQVYSVRECAETPIPRNLTRF